MIGCALNSSVSGARIRDERPVSARGVGRLARILPPSCRVSLAAAAAANVVRWPRVLRWPGSRQMRLPGTCLRQAPEQLRNLEEQPLNGSVQGVVE
jgi:hypothetical protein